MTEEMLELLRLLEEHQVRYLVIGGVAVNLHGYSRNTKDIDIWVAADEPNLLALYEALKEWFGGTSPVEKGYLLSHKGVFVLGLSPNRVDLLTEATGPSFESVYPNRIRVERRGVEFNTVHLEDLIALKLAAGRPQDRVDVRFLRKIRLKLGQDAPEDQN
ncbi:MAG: nucleotidyl transferase AbiEii/AbiGii toxin family protein [Meiothermus silvanus]|nr:nucleotidyl transferase AbiEii/AbiGii toxin family protein [Allomeiothermus silvanus]